MCACVFMDWTIYLLSMQYGGFMSPNCNFLDHFSFFISFLVLPHKLSINRRNQSVNRKKWLAYWLFFNFKILNI
jgi:hypothetical protein